MYSCRVKSKLSPNQNYLLADTALGTNLADILVDNSVNIFTGAYLKIGENIAVQVIGREYLTTNPAFPIWIIETLTALEPQTYPLEIIKDGFSVAIITMSDKGFAGNRQDVSGPAIESIVKEKLKISFVRRIILPDDAGLLAERLLSLAHLHKFDFILTTGGTGVTARDITPEATQRVLEKRLFGFEHAMTKTSFEASTSGIISRSMAGIIANSIIINFPGSVKAVTENLHAVLPALEHAILKLQGDTSDCVA